MQRLQASFPGGLPAAAQEEHRTEGAEQGCGGWLGDCGGDNSQIADGLVECIGYITIASCLKSAAIG
jgi:hypothetical protein